MLERSPTSSGQSSELQTRRCQPALDRVTIPPSSSSAQGSLGPLTPETVQAGPQIQVNLVWGCPQMGDEKNARMVNFTKSTEHYVLLSRNKFSFFNNLFWGESGQSSWLHVSNKHGNLQNQALNCWRWIDQANSGFLYNLTVNNRA